MRIDARYWLPLDTELAHWRRADRRARLWWRDDDVIQPSAHLDHLLQLSVAFNVPLALAAIPWGAGRPLAQQIAGFELVAVLQHGYAHDNHASAQEKKSEFGASRGEADVVRELRKGFRHMQGLFRERFVAVFVPPWNRFADPWLASLPEIGFSAISRFGDRLQPWPCPGLLAVNTHVDLIDWRNGRGFVGVQNSIAAIVRHLAERRLGDADAAEPVGFLTHHLVHDDDCWAFLERFFARYAHHDALEWRDIVSMVGGQ